jgi:hypothetical protein
MRQIILIEVRRNVNNILIEPRTRFQLNTPALRILPGNLLRAGVDEGIFLSESFYQRSKGLGTRRSERAKGAFLFSLCGISSRLLSKIYPFASASRLAFATAGVTEAASAALVTNKHPPSRR